MPRRANNIREVANDVGRKRRRPIVMERLVSRADADRSFDLAFWRRAGAEARWVAMWLMLREADLIRGGDGSIPRLDRSVAKLVRRRRAKPRRRARSGHG